MINHWPLSEETQEPTSSRKVGQAVAHWANSGLGMIQNTKTYIDTNTNTSAKTNTKLKQDAETWQVHLPPVRGSGDLERPGPEQ